MHHIFCCHGFSSFSTSRRRTVSVEMRACPVIRTSSPASNSNVHFARPGGGLAQAKATSIASSFVDSFRRPPGRGCSDNACSRPSSTNRRLVLYTVDVPTPTARAISSSLLPLSAASRTCARLIRRTCPTPPTVRAFNWSRSSGVSSTMYRTFIQLPPNERRGSRPSRQVDPPMNFTEKQGQYLAFIYAYTKLH